MLLDNMVAHRDIPNVSVLTTRIRAGLDGISATDAELGLKIYQKIELTGHTFEILDVF